MTKQTAVVVYVLIMVAIIVGVDTLFLRSHLWSRLAVNAAIVVLFGAVYLLFLHR